MSIEGPRRKPKERLGSNSTEDAVKRYEGLKNKFKQAETLPKAKGIGEAFSDAAMVVGALVEENNWLKALGETPQVTDAVGHAIWERKQIIEAGKKSDTPKDKTSKKQPDPLELLYTQEGSPTEEVAARLAEAFALMQKTDADSDELIERFGEKYGQHDELLTDVRDLIYGVRRSEQLAGDHNWLRSIIENSDVATVTIKKLWSRKDEFSNNSDLEDN